MPRSHKAIDGFAVDLLGQIITQFLTFVSIPIIISNTNQSNYGFWLTIGSIMTWISITDLGIGTALTRQLIKVQTKFAGDQLLDKRNVLLSTSFVFFLLLLSSFLSVRYSFIRYRLNGFIFQLLTIGLIFSLTFSQHLQVLFHCLFQFMAE